MLPTIKRINPFTSTLIVILYCKLIVSSNVCSKLQQCQSETIPIIDHQPSYGEPKWPLTYTCRNLRDNLDCLLSLSPFCDRRDSLTSQTTWNLIYKSKIYLDQKCDREVGIMDSPCYRSSDVKKCENYNPSPGQINLLNCWKFNKFRECIYSAIRTACSPQEQNLVNQYLIDRSKNMSWLCVNVTTPPPIKLTSMESGQDQNNFGPDRKQSTDLMINDKSTSDQQTPSSINRDLSVSGQYLGYPTIVGPPPGAEPYPPGNVIYGRPDRIPIGGRYPDYNGLSPGSAGYQPYIGSGTPYDRPSYGYPGSVGSGSIEICLERSRYIAQHCENALLQSMRIAHHYRTPFQVQRVICCGLFYYRDCIYQVLYHVCPGSDPMMLSMALPVSVNQQLSTCRSYSRGQCSSGLTAKSSSLTTTITLFFSFFIIHFFIKW